MVRYRPVLLVCLVLILTTLAVFWQVGRHEFVNFDDNVYVTETPQVAAGITVEGLVWAFTALHAGYWIPLTWLSHMLDCEIFGVNPGAHHFHSLLLHVTNTVFLFFLFRRMTGALWRSAFVAAVFALHPLHVESVAWVAERKDVLSAFFWILTLWCYTRYTERPGWGRYVAVFVSFALGLMAKPMLVTLPFVMLLLDYWPLGRLRLKASPSVLPLIGEKVPLIALAVLAGLLTLLAKEESGALVPLETLALGPRMAHALVVYTGYLRMMIWPSGLAVLYPHPLEGPPGWHLGLSLLLIPGLSLLVIRRAAQAPYLPVGWLWYLGTLLPVLGLVQAGPQAMADRFTYLPHIGLSVMVAWGVPALLDRWRPGQALAPAGAVAALLICAFLSWRQAGYWRDGITLFRRATEVTSENYMAHNYLGSALDLAGRHAEAAQAYREALRIQPDYADAHNNLGTALGREGELDKAILHFRAALVSRPEDEAIHSNLGLALAGKGRLDEAVASYARALRIRPDDADTHYNLGLALARLGLKGRAAAHYTRALELNPGYAEAHANLGLVLAAEGRLKEAGACYAEALRLRPDYARVHNHLGLLRVRQGRPEEAKTHFLEALRLEPGWEEARRNLDAVIWRARARPGGGP